VLQPVEERARPIESPQSLSALILKADAEKRLVTGVALIPGVVDSQGELIPKDVIQKAAHGFLARYNLQHGLKPPKGSKAKFPKQTAIGEMHQKWKGGIELVESYLAPQPLTIGSQLVPEGAWIVTVHVSDDEVWERVKKQQLTGFSIGGKASVIEMDDDEAA
jgi:hypothetical protein